MPDSTSRRHPVDATARKNLRRLREHRGWSLTVAARHLGIRSVTLGSYERGDRALTVERARRLATDYGVTLADLLDPTTVVMLTQGLRPSLALDEPPVNPDAVLAAAT